MIAGLSLTFAGCGGLSGAEKAAVGKYEMVTATMYSTTNPMWVNITQTDFVYYTIELKSNKDCVIRSQKLGDMSVQKTVKWQIKNGKLEIITKTNGITRTERYTIDGDVITGANSFWDDPITLVTFEIELHRVVA